MCQFRTCVRWGRTGRSERCQALLRHNGHLPTTPNRLPLGEHILAPAHRRVTLPTCSGVMSNRRELTTHQDRIGNLDLDLGNFPCAHELHTSVPAIVFVTQASLSQSECRVCRVATLAAPGDKRPVFAASGSLLSDSRTPILEERRVSGVNV